MAEQDLEVSVVGYTGDGKHISERVIDPRGLCFTLMAMTHGWGQGYIVEYEEGVRSEQVEG